MRAAVFCGAHLNHILFFGARRSLYQIFRTRVSPPPFTDGCKYLKVYWKNLLKALLLLPAAHDAEFRSAFEARD